MYINTFKYTPKDVSCQLCTEYVKKLGCTALRCPWLAERLKEQGEIIIDKLGCRWWGRLTSGQAIYMDGVIQEICGND